MSGKTISKIVVGTSLLHLFYSVLTAYTFLLSFCCYEEMSVKDFISSEVVGCSYPLMPSNFTFGFHII